LAQLSYSADVTDPQEQIDMLKVETPDSDVVLGTSLAKEDVTTLNFATTNIVPDGATSLGDVSAAGDGSIIAWYTGDPGDYTLTIGQVGGVQANPNSSYLFQNYVNLYYTDFTNFSTTGVTDMSYIFQNFEAVIYANDWNCDALTEEVDVSGWDTSSVTTLAHAFDHVNVSDQFRVSNWDTSNVTDLSYVFYDSNNYSGNLDLSGWDTSNVTNMTHAFMDQDYEFIYMTNWTTPKVTDMSYMFASSFGSNLIEIDCSGWTNDVVTDMSYMFMGNGQIGMSIYLAGFGTPNVTNMHAMFQSSTLNTGLVPYLDLRSFDFSNVTDMGDMFDDIWWPSTIYVKDTTDQALIQAAYTGGTVVVA
jgi:surface protein